MLVRDCMSHHVEGVDAGDSVRAAAERMRALDVGSLAVFEGGHLVGFVTDRDLVVRAIARGLDPSSPVRGAMSHGVVTCFAEEDLQLAAGTMAREGVRRLVVVDRDLQPIGVLSVDDLAMRGCDPGLLAEVFAHALC